jgi:hypothetical protein
VAATPEMQPGVWTAKHPDGLPLPVQGYEVYLVGEYHGLEENAEFQTQYPARLPRESGLRDVAIEEDAVYESDEQAFVDGKSDVVTPPLCLRPVPSQKRRTSSCAEMLPQRCGMLPSYLHSS